MDENSTLCSNKDSCSDFMDNGDIRNGFIIDKLAGNNYLLMDMPFQANIFAIVLCTHGETDISVNMKSYKVKKGTVVILMPNNIISTGVSSGNLTGYYLASSTDFMDRIRISTENIVPLFIQFVNNPVIDLNEEEFLSIKKYFELLHNEDAVVHSLHRQDICAGIVTSFIYRISDMLISRQCANKELSNKSGVKLFMDFITLVRQEYRSHREVNWYAEKLCITPKYLSTVVKNISSKKASEWIEGSVIMEAKSLLKYSAKTIQEISYLLNFPNPSFFGAYFKKYGGMTPGAYRKY